MTNKDVPYTSSGSGFGEDGGCSAPESRAERRTDMSVGGATSVRLYKTSEHETSTLNSLTALVVVGALSLNRGLSVE